MRNIKSYTARHVNYHSSMMQVGIPGIWDADLKVPFYKASDPTKEAGRLNLREVLYGSLKLRDGHSFLAEIHQEHAMGPVEAVIPNVKEAEEFALMMEKNVVAVLSNHLVEVGMDATFVNALLQATCDPSLFHSAAQCTWDKATRVLTTPADVQAEKDKALEDAAWYNRAFEDAMRSPEKRGRKTTRIQRICMILTALTPSRHSLRGRVVGTAARLERLPSRLEEAGSLRRGRRRSLTWTVRGTTM